MPDFTDAREGFDNTNLLPRAAFKQQFSPGFACVCGSVSRQKAEKQRVNTGPGGRERGEEQGSGGETEAGVRCPGVGLASGTRVAWLGRGRKGFSRLSWHLPFLH